MDRDSMTALKYSTLEFIRAAINFSCLNNAGNNCDRASDVIQKMSSLDWNDSELQKSLDPYFFRSNGAIAFKPKLQKMFAIAYAIEQNTYDKFDPDVGALKEILVGGLKTTGTSQQIEARAENINVVQGCANVNALKNAFQNEMKWDGNDPAETPFKVLLKLESMPGEPLEEKEKETKMEARIKKFTPIFQKVFAAMEKLSGKSIVLDAVKDRLQRYPNDWFATKQREWRLDINNNGKEIAIYQTVKKLFQLADDFFNDRDISQQMEAVLYVLIVSDLVPLGVRPTFDQCKTFEALQRLAQSTRWTTDKDRDLVYELLSIGPAPGPSPDLIQKVNKYFRDTISSISKGTVMGDYVDQLFRDNKQNWYETSIQQANVAADKDLKVLSTIQSLFDLAKAVFSRTVTEIHREALRVFFPKDSSLPKPFIELIQSDAPLEEIRQKLDSLGWKVDDKDVVPLVRFIIGTTTNVMKSVDFPQSRFVFSFEDLPERFPPYADANVIRLFLDRDGYFTAQSVERLIPMGNAMVAKWSKMKEKEVDVAILRWAMKNDYIPIAKPVNKNPLFHYTRELNVRGNEWFAYRKRLLQTHRIIHNSAQSLDVETWDFQNEKKKGKPLQPWILKQPLVTSQWIQTIPDKDHQQIVRDWISLFEESGLVGKFKQALNEQERVQILIHRTWLFHWIGPRYTRFAPRKTDTSTRPHAFYDEVERIVQRVKELMDQNVLRLEHPLRTSSKALEYENSVWVGLDFARCNGVRAYLCKSEDRPSMLEPSFPFHFLYYELIDTIRNALDFEDVQEASFTLETRKKLVRTTYEPYLSKIKDYRDLIESWVKAVQRSYEEYESYAKNVRRASEISKIIKRAIPKSEREADKADETSLHTPTSLAGVSVTEDDLRQYCEKLEKHKYPAFRVDDEGKLQPMCGDEKWTDLPATPLEATYMKAMHELSLEWTVRPQQVLQLWRWIGMACAEPQVIREHIRVILAQKAITSGNVPLWAGAMGDVDAVEPGKDPNCLARIGFLYQMMNSGIFFPFVVNHAAAEQIAKRYMDRVVLMPHWADSGRVLALMMTKDGFVEHSLDCTFLPAGYAPTRMRLWVFEQFGGAVVAPNQEWLLHIRKMRDPKDPPQTSFNLLPLLTLLPDDKAAQLRARVARGETGETLRPLYETASALAMRHLTASDMEWYQKIRVWEKQPDLAAMRAAYQERFVKGQSKEAQQLEVLNLCHRPEFIGYLRKRYAASDEPNKPPLDVIAKMSRAQLCMKWLGLKAVDIRLPLSQVRKFSDELSDGRDPSLLAIYSTDTTQLNKIDTWLQANYGVTLAELRRYNPAEVVEQERAVLSSVVPAALDVPVDDDAKHDEDIQRIEEYVQKACSMKTRLSSKQLQTLLEIRKELAPTGMASDQTFTQQCIVIQEAWQRIKSSLSEDQKKKLLELIRK